MAIPPGATISKADAPPLYSETITPSRRRVHLGMAECVVLVALFALSVELACRVEDWIRFRMPIISPFTAQDQLLIRDQDGVHGRPAAQFQKWSMNNLGFRGPDVALVPVPGTIRIATVGASETFGLYESPGREFPRQLEDSVRSRLAARCPGRPAPTVEVLNAALPGMSLPTVGQDIRTRIAKLHPDVVVAYPTPAQYLEDRLPSAAKPDSSAEAGTIPAARWWTPRVLARLRQSLKTALPSALTAWLRRRDLENTLATHPSGWRFDDLPGDRLAAFERDLRTLVGTIRRTGAVPVLVTHTNWFQVSDRANPDLLGAWERFYPKAPGPVLVAFDSAGGVITTQVAADSAFARVDGRAAIASLRAAAFADYAHFTDRGAAAMAGAIATTLEPSFSASRRSCR